MCYIPKDSRGSDEIVYKLGYGIVNIFCENKRLDCFESFHPVGSCRLQD